MQDEGYYDDSDEDAYPHALERDEAEFNPYWVFDSDTVGIRDITTEELIVEAVAQMDECAGDLRDEGDSAWLDHVTGWEVEPLMDQLFDIRDLPEHRPCRS
jgi:hypothetical protein